MSFRTNRVRRAVARRCAAGRTAARITSGIATLIVGVILLLPVSAAAQPASGSSTVSITARKSASVKITTLGGNDQTIVIEDGVVTQYAAPVRVRLDWSFPPNQTDNLYLVGFFLEAGGALRSGDDVIPASYFEGRVGATASWAAFANTYAYPTSPGTSGNALLLWTSPSTRNSGRRGSVTLDLYLRLNLAGRAVPAGDYSGTLMLQAFTQ